MRFYRVHISTVQDSSLGFQFLDRKKDALRVAAEFKRQHKDDRDNITVEITDIDIVPNKSGILRALNIYASHPDNG